MKVLLLTHSGRQDSSSRIRFLQYLPLLRQQDIEVDVSPLLSDKYVLSKISGKSIISYWNLIFLGYWGRVKILFKVKSYDLIIIHKEIFPYVPAFVERLFHLIGVFYIVDYDDATYHNYDNHSNYFVRLLLGKKIDTIMRFAKIVIVGNKYLSLRAELSRASKIEIIPSVVDLDKYKVVKSNHNKRLVVGWIGSPSTGKYLLEIESIYNLLASEFDVRFVAVGCNKETLKNLPIEVLPWSEETEVQLIQSFDVGIMPLSNSLWEKGKCGYKLIQYMACGLPVVASPIGINKQIIENGKNGFLAQEPDEWVGALRQLLNDESLRRFMGENGRKCVEKVYSLQVQSKKFEKIINNALSLKIS
jgi:glycosyltransferase involved in cell wall biosynthesis